MLPSLAKLFHNQTPTITVSHRGAPEASSENFMIFYLFSLLTELGRLT